MGRGVERKFFDTIRIPNVPGTGGTIFSPSINLLPQGADAFERIGLKATIVSIHFRFLQFCLSNNVIDATGDAHRIIVYLDRQANGAAATPAQILEAPVSISSFNNLENSNRFHILMDKTSSFGSMAGGISAAQATNPTFKVLKWNKRCRIPIRFGGATGALTEIQSNNIGVLIVSANAATSCNIRYTARIRFTDM